MYVFLICITDLRAELSVGRAGAQINAHRCELGQNRSYERILKGTPCGLYVY